MAYALLRPLLFALDAETAHAVTLSTLDALVSIGCGTVIGGKHLSCPRSVMGINFPNPVGLAAGLDKDARVIDEMASLGFGFIEIGTLTPRPQPGNDKPRLFRLTQDHALINRMGFNNEGVEAAVARLKKRKSRVIVGGNIGKNKTTANEDALQDYVACFHALDSYVDYFVINVSSPNTPGLRELQEKEPLERLLSTIKALSLKSEKPKPVLLKIAPDLTWHQLDDVVEILLTTKTDGVIATNTTVSRADLKTPDSIVQQIGNGGLSGAPLAGRSTEVIRYLRAKLGDAYPIVGVGGIMSPEDALEKLKAGANLIQLYTGFIYEGPGLVKRINEAIVAQG